MKNINTEKKMYRVLFFLISWLLSYQFVQAQWVQTNGPYGGDIRALIVSGTNIFAGTYGGGGVFLSTNNGTNWTAVNTGLPFDPQAGTYVDAFAISNTNLFAGINNSGVFLSTNNGTNWTDVNTGLTNLYVEALAVSGTNLFAGTYGGGIFLSTNNGTNWTAVNTGLTNTDVWSLTVSGTNLYAGTDIGGFLSTNNGVSWTKISNGLPTNTNVFSFGFNATNILAGTYDGVFISTDNGISWSNTGLQDHIFTFAFSGTNIFAGSEQGHIFLSTNNGSSWTNVSSIQSVSAVYAFAFFPNGAGDENLLAGTTSGVFLSTNNGTNWSMVDNGLSNTNVYSLAISGTCIFDGTENGVFLSTNNGASWSLANIGFRSGFTRNIFSFAVSGTNIFAATDDGVYLSTNKGTSWTQTGLTYVYVQALAVSGTNVVAGLLNAGIFISSNNGATWTSVNNGLPVTDHSIQAIAALNSNIFVCTRDNTNGNGEVFLSTNNGASWNAVDNGLPKQLLVKSLAISGSNIFAGTNQGVYFSTNNGTSWTAINNATSWTGNGIFATNLAVFDTNIFAAMFYGGVFLSTNNGTSWAAVNNGLPTNKLGESYIAISNTDIFYGNRYGNIWRRPLSEMISSVSVWQIDINIKDNGNISQSLSFGQLPSATDGIDAGLGEAPLPPAPFGFDARFHLPTGDDSWTDYRSSAKDTVKWIIKFQPGSGGYPMTFSWDKTALPKGKITLTDAVTGTLVNVDMTANSSYTLTNTGITSLIIQYIASSTPTSVKNINTEIPTVYSLMQNYPNPFNPTTVIKYGLPGNSNVKLKIYNVLGQLVESLVNGMQPAGYHEVTWNASNKASGVYLCSIEAVSTDNNKTFHSVKKLLLLK
jgi:hypothetical protein